MWRAQLRSKNQYLIAKVLEFLAQLVEALLFGSVLRLSS